MKNEREQIAFARVYFKKEWDTDSTIINVE